MANTKNSEATTTKRVKKEYTETEKRANWKEAGNKRGNAVIRSLIGLRRCARPSRYSWTEAEVSKVLAAIASALQDVERTFQNPTKRQSTGTSLF